MDLPAGPAVVVAILVVLPLGAVRLARIWRDPPPVRRLRRRADAAVVANGAG